MNYETYIKRYQDVMSAKKRCQEQLGILRKKEIEARTNLYNLMIRSGVQQLGEIKLNQIKPPEKKQRKKETEKREEIKSVMEEYGIEDADRVYKEIKNATKSKSLDSQGAPRVSSVRGAVIYE